MRPRATHMTDSNKQGGLHRMEADGSTGWAPKQGIHPCRNHARPVPHRRTGFRCALVWLGVSVCLPPLCGAGVLDQLPDLTDKAAQAVVTLKGRDNFNSEYLYDVSVKNLSSDPLVGESLVVVLDKITGIGGDERTSGTRESILSRMEILGQDGETDDGKPYFRIPRGSGPDLPPYTESSPVTVRIRNKDYLIVFTPFFKVYGQQRTPDPPKPMEPVSPAPPARTPTDKLIQMLIQKGVLSEEEARALYQP